MKLLLLATSVAYITTAGAGTLDNIKKSGFLTCGVTTGTIGFSQPDDKNSWSGLDVDFCKAISAGIFNDATKVKYFPLSAKNKFTALQSGEVDLLSRVTTNTMTRDTTLGVNFIAPFYYDGQGFMVRKSLGIKSAKDLSGASVCTDTGTTTELNMTDYFKSNNLEYTPVVFEKIDEVITAYGSGRCDVVSSDISSLNAYRTKLKNPDEHIVLPDVISKEPLSPVVRQGDDQWFDLVNWTRSCLINAEELGVNSKNIDEQVKSKSPNIKRLLGVGSDFGKGIGLDSNWCKNIISQVGNYGEVFDRNLGKNSKITINRGLNNLWNNGGIMYSAPIR